MTSTPAAPRLRGCDEAHAAEVTGGGITQVEPSVDYSAARPPVYGRGDRWAILEGRLPAVLPATRVASLPGAFVVGTQGWVVTPDRHVVVSLSWYESVGRAPSLASVRWEDEYILNGTVLNLATMNAAVNYGHFLLDGLGRLAVADGLAITPDTVDWVLLAAFPSPGAELMLQRVGLSPERTVRAVAGVAVTGDVVLTPSMPGTARVYRPVLPRFLRRAIPRSAGQRRIYVSRRGGRRPLINADQVEAVAVEHGFEVVDPLTADMPATLAAASAVIGAHGAALADLAFCRPGTAVVELMPSDHMFPYYFSLALAGELRYSAVVGASTQERDPEEWGGSPYGFEVRPNDLHAALEAIG
jgi:Glycosyltransferase 61